MTVRPNRQRNSRTSFFAASETGAGDALVILAVFNRIFLKLQSIYQAHCWLVLPSLAEHPHQSSMFSKLFFCYICTFWPKHCGSAGRSSNAVRQSSLIREADSSASRFRLLISRFTVVFFSFKYFFQRFASALPRQSSSGCRRLKVI